MEWLLYVVAVVFTLLGAACVGLVVFQLHGTWILLILAAAFEYLDRYYLGAEQQTFGWWVLGICLLLAFLGEILEFMGSALGAKKAGASTRGIVGSIIGAILGPFILTPLFFFVPLLGVLLGVVAGSFVGAVLGEMSAERATLKGTVKPAFGAAAGRIIGTIGKVWVAIAMWLTLSIAAFWP